MLFRGSREKGTQSCRRKVEYLHLKTSRLLFSILWMTTILLGLLPDEASAKPRYLPTEEALISLPAEALIGSQVTFTVTFDNNGDEPGFGPYIDVVLPAIGMDGSDGITFQSASYLGAALPDAPVVQIFPAPTGCVNHPWAVTNTGAPVQVCGTIGDQLVSLMLPFGSFFPLQPPAPITIVTNLSNFADLAAPLTVQANAGFIYGRTPINDYTTDPSRIGAMDSAAITPTLFTLTKEYIGPEDETATGPNYPRQYTITVDIANGQPISDFRISDFLPNNLQFLSLDASTPAGGVAIELPTLGSAQNPPNNDLIVRWASVTGTAGANDASITFSYFIPLNDANSAAVIYADSGDDVPSIDDAAASGSWDPLDPGDPVTPAVSDVTSNDHTLTDKSIAIQKSGGILVDNAAPNLSPEDVLEYTLEFQVSDYFAFQNLVLQDILSDGQRLDETYAPRLSINGNQFSLPVTAMDSANYDIIDHYTGGTPQVPPIDGTTEIIFRISDELVTNSLPMWMVGGCVPMQAGGANRAPGNTDCSTSNNGPTTGTITFHTIVQDEFSDDYLPNDPSVDQGDILRNDVPSISGDLLRVTDLSLTGFSEADDSGATLEIPRGVLAKSIYAINGSTSFPSPVRIAPGDVVTYRLRYTLPTADVEDLDFVDYLPAPVFRSTEVTTFDYTVSASAPPAGTIKFGPADSFYNYIQASATPFDPTLSTDGTQNSLTIYYGDFDDPANLGQEVDLLFSVTVRSDPFADGLYLTNQARAHEGSTNSGQSDADAIIQIQLTEPVLAMRKGVVASNNPAGVFTPAPPVPAGVTFTTGACATRMSGTLNSTNLATSMDSDLSAVDAGDTVALAIVIENTGSGLNGAFDVRVSDSLPAGMTFVSGSLCVTDGTGLTISTTDLGGGLFGSGIELVDPGPTPSPDLGAIDAYDPTDGHNIAIISYLVTLDATDEPLQVLTNTATLFNFAGTNGGDDHTVTDLTDPATVTIATPAALKELVDSEINHVNNTSTQVVIGELVDYRVTLTIPEGVTSSAVLTDTLDAGLAFVQCQNITASAGLTTSLGNFANACNDPANPTVGAGGQVVTYDLGTITNANRVNATPETIVIEYQAVVLNVAGNVTNTLLNNSAVFSWQGHALPAVSAPNVTVIEPRLDPIKTIAPLTGDAGDPITYTVTLQRLAGNTVDAFDVTVTDALPRITIAGVPTTSFIILAEPTPAFAVVDSAGILTAANFEIVGDNTNGWTLRTVPGFTFDFLGTEAGRTITITIPGTVSPLSIPGRTYTNTAYMLWTSLDGDYRTTPRSDYSANAIERIGIIGNPLDNYTDPGSAVFTHNAPALTKTLVTTSEAHTAGNAVAIGEIARYRLVVRIPEGTSVNTRITDNLPAGLSFLNANSTAMIALVGDGAGVSSSAFAGAGLQQVGDETTIATIVPTFPVPLANITGGPPWNDGTDPVFNLGSITNADSDPNFEYIVIEFNALVDNVIANQQFNNANGASTPTTRNNNFGLNIDTNPTLTSANLPVTIAEPDIYNLAKTPPAGAPDAGDSVNYVFTFSNVAAAATVSAFDVRFTDSSIPVAYFTVTGVSVVMSDGSTYIDNTVGNLIDITIPVMAPGVSCTITVTATVVNNVPAGQTINNTARVVYSSLPGTGTAVNPTGESTPGGSGNAFGERDGSGAVGGLNDYLDTASATLNLAIPAIDKLVPAPLTYAIGEEVTYTLLVTLPEGVTRALVVTDDLPAGLVYVPASSVIDTSTFNGTLPVPVITAPGGSGDNVIYNFGDTTVVDDNVTTNNSFTITLRARVNNEIANQDGTPLDNTGSLTYTRNGVPATITDAPVRVNVIEPLIVVDKNITVPPVPPDAGGVVTYQVVLSHDANSHLNAYDMHFEDVLPSGLVNIQNVTLTPSGFGAYPPPVTFDGLGGTTLRVPSGAGTFDMPLGATLTIEFQATIDLGVAPGQDITNTGTVWYSSLDGTFIYERDGETAPACLWQPGLPPACLNDYRNAGSDTFTTGGSLFQKALATTDEAATSGDELSIGEIVTYGMVVTLPEGTINNVSVADTLPTYLEYVDASVVTQAAASYSLLPFNFAGTLPAPVITAPPANPNGGGTATLDFASVIVDGDNDITNNSFLVLVRARVMNLAANQQGQVRTNNASLNYQGLAAPIASNPLPITVVEPELGMTKSVVSILPANPSNDAGDTVTYQVNLYHLASTAMPALDVHFTDILPADLVLNLASVSCAPAICTNNSAGNTVDLTIANFPETYLAGNPLVITFQAVIADTVEPGQTVTNGADVAWTSRTGVVAGERDGSGGVNDYAAQATIDFDIGDPAFSKALTATSAGHTLLSDVTIGEVITYTLTVTLPEGTTTGLVVTDDLPVGLQYVPRVSVLDTTGFAGAVAEPVVAAAGGSGGDVTFTFAPITVTSNENPADNSFRILVDALVLDEAGNVGLNPPGQTVLTNNASLQVGTQPAIPAAPVNATVVEPQMTITKSALPTDIAPGETVTFTLTVANTGTSDAYDVIIEDPLPLARFDTIAAVSTPPGFILTTPVVGTDTVVTYTAQPGTTVVHGAPALSFVFSARLITIAPAEVLTNTATVTQTTTLDGADPNERDEPDVQDTVNLNGSVIDLTLSKDDGGITTTPGGLVIYTLTYANIGNRAATGVIIEETLPPHSTFDAANSDPGWICTNPPACTDYQLTIGPLGAAPAGGTAAFAVIVDNPLASGVTQIDNAATIYDDGTNGDEADLTNNDAADFTPVDAAPALLITKDDGITQTAAGATLVYDIVLTNNGDQDATGVFISDTIPVELENPSVLSVTRSDAVPPPDYEITGGDTLRVPSGAGTFDLPVGTTITVRLQADVKDPVPGNPPYFTNLAHAEDDGSNTGGRPVIAEDDDTDALRDLTKALVDMSHHDPALGRDVYIGELLTYEASFVIAPGQLDNLHLVDTMDAGLAVVYCESITASPGTGIVEDPAHPFNDNTAGTAVCPGIANLASTSFTPSPLNTPDQPGDARIVDFNFGTVQNTGAVDETITVRYVVAVLDTAANVRGVALENTALWTWTGNTGGLQQTAGPVTILEPTLTITKDVDRTTALPGSVVTFTVVIANDGPGTNSDAFDVTITDVLPATLVYVPLSMTFAGYPVTSWSDAAPTLTATWDVLPIGESATITFQARVNLRPGRGATNTAAVEWSSLPGDFTAPQSPFNRFSTERYYDPNDPVNIYGGAASIAVSAPDLPETGFAPGRVTVLPEQPLSKSYASLDEFRLMIPVLGVDIPIVGVPGGTDGWDLTWLRDQAGYLEGTAYPTWNGNSGITAHVYDANGNPGPFVDLHKLKWGDQIIVQSFGQKYVYVVREVIRTYAGDLSVLRHEEKPWLTLITCQGFNEQTGLYIWRIAVRAELARVE